MPDLFFLILLIVFLGLLVVTLLSRMGRGRADELLVRISRLEKRVSDLQKQVQSIQRPEIEISAERQPVLSSAPKQQTDESTIVAHVVQENVEQKRIEEMAKVSDEQSRQSLLRPCTLHRSI